MRVLRHGLVACAVLIVCAAVAPPQDPGVRPGVDAGGPLASLTPAQLALFTAGRAEFLEEEGLGDGLGPRFNLDSCAGCHAQPAVGGTSPALNPQVALATAGGASPRLCGEMGRL
jgi:hypothetical protein